MEDLDQEALWSAHHDLCCMTVEALAKLRKEDREAFSEQVEHAIDALMLSKVRASAHLARSIVLSADPRLDEARQESAVELAAFNRVLSYYGHSEVAL